MSEEKKSPVLKILLIGCLVIVVLGAVGIGGCTWWATSQMSKAAVEQVPPLMSEYSDLVADHPDAAELQSLFGQTSQLAADGKFNAWAFSAVVATAEKVKDGGLDDSEVEQLRGLCQAIVDGGGTMSMSELGQYSQQ